MNPSGDSFRPWQHIFEFAAWGVAVGSADGTTLDMVNPAYARMHGYTVDELQGLPIRTVYPPHLHASISRNIALNHEAGHRQFETYHQHRNGLIFPVLVDVTTVKSDADEVLYRIVHIQDITERKKLERELEQREKFLENVIDYSAVGMAIADRRGRYTRVNQAMCEFVGYSAAELLTMSYHDITYPEDLDQNVEAREYLLAGETKTFQMEKRYVRKDGQVVWALMVISVIPSANGEIEYTVGQMLDIDTLKRTEQSLRESQQLLREMAARQQSLLEEERKRFAHEVHDELGQLLTALKMDVSLIRLNYGDRPELADKAAGMRDLIDRTLNVVRHISMDLRPAVVDMGLLPALEWLAQEFAEQYGIACRIEAAPLPGAPDDACVMTVFRIVQESLTNVARHARASQVHITLGYDDHGLSLTITDDGCGFQPEAVAATASFGLMGMRERARSLDGHLKIISTPGTGTSIVLALPCRKGSHT
ncbi:MAG: PAS domain S-box protein [Rhodocyclaceae bacterium]|nr:MAG: PAS domain S-box protein [Rhodocyclaceae bacterium]